MMRSIVRMGCWLVMLSAIVACAGERNDRAAAEATAPTTATAPATPAGSGDTQIPSPPVPSAVAPTPGGRFDSSLAAHAALTFDCETASDCAIKDVGNCCGTYPACVSVDSPVDSAAVARECADRNLSGICGYPVIEACVCTAGRCEAASGAGTGADIVR